MNYYQNNLESDDKVYFAVEAEDAEKVTNVLQNESIPVNGMYTDPLEIVAHEEIEKLNIDDDDVKQETIQEAVSKLTEIVTDSWSDIIASIESYDVYKNSDKLSDEIDG